MVMHNPLQEEEGEKASYYHNIQQNNLEHTQQGTVEHKKQLWVVDVYL